MGMGQKPVSPVFTSESYPPSMFRFTRSKSLTSEMNRSIFQKYRIFRPKGWDWFLRLVQHQFLGVISGISLQGSPMTSSPNFCMGPEIGWVHTPIIPNLWPLVCFFNNFLDKQPHDLRKQNSERPKKKSLMRKFCQTNCCLLSPSSLAHGKVSAAAGAWVSSTRSWKRGINVRFLHTKQLPLKKTSW